MSQNFLSIHAKSFNWAGFFLPKKTYEHCSNLYDFCRTLDDIVDQELDLEIKKKLFENFKNFSFLSSKSISSSAISSKVLQKSYKVEHFL